MPAVRPWLAEYALRGWQTLAFRKYLQTDRPDFMLVATPGAGKTTFALYVAHAALMEGTSERIVIVVPTEHLKKQWKKAAHKIGLNLSATWTNSDGAESRDYHGVIVTYQQVAQAPALHQRHCQRRPTLVVFDEIHHAGESYSWGVGLRDAFAGAARRLSMSGTPFRSDSARIPFVPYQEGVSTADYAYGYADALRDNVCRPVLFPSLEGRMEWYRRGEVRNHTFDDLLTQRLAAERLRTAIDPGCEWIATAIQEADAQLTEVRRAGHPAAGGLLIAMRQEHTTALAKLVHSISGEWPIVAVSDDPDASDKIEQFAHGQQRWIIAVRMVSEGVDIPRLRVAIFGTNITTELYFRQAVGRLVRMVGTLEDEHAYFYIPKEPILVAYAETIKHERDHQLEEEIRERLEATAAGEGDQRQELAFQALSAIGAPGDVIFQHDRFTQQELGAAADLQRQAGIPETIPSVYFAIYERLRRQQEGAGPNLMPTPAPPLPDQPLEDRKKGLGQIIRRLVARLKLATGTDFALIYARLNQGQGVSSQQQCTEAQLRERIAELRTWAKEEGLSE